MGKISRSRSTTETTEPIKNGCANQGSQELTQYWSIVVRDTKGRQFRFQSEFQKLKKTITKSIMSNIQYLKLKIPTCTK